MEVSDDEPPRNDTTGGDSDLGSELSEPTIDDLRDSFALFESLGSSDFVLASDSTISPKGRPQGHSKTVEASRIDPDELAQMLAQAPQAENTVLPKKFAHFRVVRLIGSGQFGLVYEAVDEKLQRKVAIKAARTEVSTDPHRLERFAREAILGSRLDHPGIVPIYEIGIERGQLFIAMAYCESRTLDVWLHECRPILSHGLAVQFALQILDAVDHGHRRGVIHRDLKPGNIGVTDVDGASSGLGHPTLRVLDFGLSCPTDSKERDTATELLMGTPLYMAPEQLSSSDVTEAADVYSVGTILYEMLTGVAPFEGKSQADVIHKVKTAELVSPDRHNPTIDRDLAAVVTKALRRRPYERYPTASEFSDDLKRWLAREPTLARPDTAFTKFIRWTGSEARIPEVGATLFGINLVTLVWLLLSAAMLSLQVPVDATEGPGFWGILTSVSMLTLPLHAAAIYLGQLMWRRQANVPLMIAFTCVAIISLAWIGSDGWGLFASNGQLTVNTPSAQSVFKCALAIVAVFDMLLLAVGLHAVKQTRLEMLERAVSEESTHMTIPIST